MIGAWLAWRALLSVVAVEGASTPIITALITAGFSFAGMVIVAVKTFRIDNGKTDLADFQEMRQNWKDEIAELKKERDLDSAEIARLRDDRSDDRKRIAVLEGELLLSHRREAYLMEQLGITARPRESRERESDG